VRRRAAVQSLVDRHGIRCTKRFTLDRRDTRDDAWTRPDRRITRVVE
jgi:hypothetical protein